MDRLADDTVGVSGSRETNETGREWIQSLSTYLVQNGYTIVSGGAQGADTAAHKGAIESNAATIAVLGTGVNVAYPPENESLFTRIVEKDGLLVSMFPPEAEPTRHSFLERNELLAALSKGMIFVATDGSGGTMAQYEIATEQGKPIFVPPSDLGIEPAEGISTLRESTSASIIRTASDLSEALADSGVDQTNLDNWT